MRLLLLVLIILSLGCKGKEKQQSENRGKSIEPINFNTGNPPQGMCFIRGGTYQMGDPRGRHDTAPAHKVILSSFYMDTTEVTQNSYMEFINNMPEQLYPGSNHPVTKVSWFDAVGYCNARSKAHGLDTVYTFSYYEEQTFVKIHYEVIGYRLPTEAEWEYAARGGTEYIRYYWGDIRLPNGEIIDGAKFQEWANKAKEYEWYKKNSGNKAHQVALKKPNPWGLFDMLGNVQEWCNDWYIWNYYEKSEMNNPKGPGPGPVKQRVTRGGTFWNSSILRLTYRRGFSPKDADPTQGHRRSPAQGFRCVLPAQEEDS